MNMHVRPSSIRTSSRPVVAEASPCGQDQPMDETTHDVIFRDVFVYSYLYYSKCVLWLRLSHGPPRTTPSTQKAGGRAMEDHKRNVAVGQPRGSEGEHLITNQDTV